MPGIGQATFVSEYPTMKVLNLCLLIVAFASLLATTNTLCASDETTNTFWLKKWFNCGAKMLYKTMSMVRGMNVVIKLSSKLPKDTSNCYVSATQDVVDSCNAYVPNINQCIASIKGKNFSSEGYGVDL